MRFSLAISFFENIGLKFINKKESVMSGNANLMAREGPICPVLQSHYEMPAKKKIRFLETREAKLLFDGLPRDVSLLLRNGFLSGRHGVDIPGWDKVVDYFQVNSEIIPALTKNPGTFTMLERMYHLHPISGVIDEYFLLCKAGGQALKNRYDAITTKSCQVVESILSRQNSCLIADFGSGPGRNLIEMLKTRPDFRVRVVIDCVDVDQAAIDKGRELTEKENLGQVIFTNKDMAKLYGHFQKNIDYGLLIGVLCGMQFRDRVVLLKKLRRYFKPGSKLIAAALLDEMAKEDLLCSYILRETANWGLQFRPLGELKRAFDEAGWVYEGYFQEQPTRFYEIGIGSAP